MKKNFTVNISGILFNIDEDAYQRLQAYLERLRRHFEDTSGRDEIISDIESRIAEMMQEKLSETKRVITIDDISEIVKLMGEPTDFEGEEQQSEHADTQEEKNYSKRGNKRLYRDPDNKIVGGVASGLGAYFGIDPTWVRLIFIVATFFGGSGAIVYVILWAILQEAITTAQKLEMRGEPVNIDNIEKSIENEINNLGDKLNELKNKHFKKKSEPNIFERFAQLIIQLITGFVRLIGMILAGSFAIVALALIVTFMVSLFTHNTFFVHQFHGTPFASIPTLLELIYASESEINLVLTGLIIVVLVPLLGIVYGGVRVIFGIERRIPNMKLSFFVIWITGVVLLGIGGWQTSRLFATHQQDATEIDSVSDTDVLYVKIKAVDYISSMSYPFDIEDAIHSEFLFFYDDSTMYNVPEIRFRESEDDQFHITVKRAVNGEYLSDTREKLDNIQFEPEFQDSLMLLPPYYSFPFEDRWRNQEVRLYIYVPKGKTVQYLPHNSFDDEYLDAIDNHYRYIIRHTPYHRDYLYFPDEDEDKEEWMYDETMETIPEDENEGLPADSIRTDSNTLAFTLKDVLVPLAS